MRMQVILDSLFARPGSAPIGDGKKGEFRDWTKYSPAKTAEYLGIFPNFQNCACCEKYLKDKEHNSLHLTLKICSDICPWTLSVPQSSQFFSSYALGKLFSSRNR